MFCLLATITPYRFCPNFTQISTHYTDSIYSIQSQRICQLVFHPWFGQSELSMDVQIHKCSKGTVLAMAPHQSWQYTTLVDQLSTGNFQTHVTVHHNTWLHTYTVKSGMLIQLFPHTTAAYPLHRSHSSVSLFPYIYRIKSQYRNTICQMYLIWVNNGKHPTVSKGIVLNLIIGFVCVSVWFVGCICTYLYLFVLYLQYLP